MKFAIGVYFLRIMGFCLGLGFLVGCLFGWLGYVCVCVVSVGWFWVVWFVCLIYLQVKLSEDRFALETHLKIYLMLGKIDSSSDRRGLEVHPSGQSSEQPQA